MLIKKTHITCPSSRYIKWYASCILLRLFWTFLLQAPRKRRRLSQKHEDTSFCGVSYPYRPTCLTLGRDVRVGDLPLSANIYLLLLVIKWVDLLKTLCQYCRVSGTFLGFQRGMFCRSSQNGSFPFRREIHTQNLLKVIIHKRRKRDFKLERQQFPMPNYRWSVITSSNYT